MYIPDELCCLRLGMALLHQCCPGMCLNHRNSSVLALYYFESPSHGMFINTGPCIFAKITVQLQVLQLSWCWTPSGV